MSRFTSLLAVLALLGLAAPIAAQEDTPPAAPETPETVAPETPDAMAPETPDTSEVASTHDWEFSLQPNDKAPSATAVVMVTEGDPENSFVVEITGLPPVDELDTPERDVNAYTVWIAPSKEQVRESTLAGSLTVDAEGNANFEGTTALDSFGIMILATENGAPTALVGTPVLTGIPAPEAAAPESWTRELAAQCVAAIDRMVVGEWGRRTSFDPSQLGKPVAPRTKETMLTAVRAFFRDLQEWGWIPRRFHPRRDLATPPSVRDAPRRSAR